MATQTPTDRTTPLRLGSLFSGYGGLDLAVEEAFDACTVWFSEINQPVARVFSHHWPDAPNLGDITAINWGTVPPIDILCGGFPCQDISTVGKMAGLKPGTRSGLWAHMAAAIDVLQPEWVVIENVRGLLSADAIRAGNEGDKNEQRNPEHANPEAATSRGMERDPWHLGETAARPLRAAGAVLGDLADLRYDAQWIGLPASAIGAPHPRYRVFILARRTVPDPARLGRLPRRRESAAGEGASWDHRAFTPDHRLRPPRTAWLTEQEQRLRDSVFTDRRAARRWGRYADAITRWERITGRQAPSPELLTKKAGPRPAPEFVEWLMGLPTGWVTAEPHGLTLNQQTAVLGNGVLPIQALYALRAFFSNIG